MKMTSNTFAQNGHPKGQKNAEKLSKNQNHSLGDERTGRQFFLTISLPLG